MGYLCGTINQILFIFVRKMSRKYKFKDFEEDWLYSRAKQYHSGEKGKIEIIQIDPIIVTY
jgi:hypothetical protein